MSTDFTYGGKQIVASGPFKPTCGFGILTISAKDSTLVLASTGISFPLGLNGPFETI